MYRNKLCTNERGLLADDIAGMYYGPQHPMKPQRITLTHHLILGYGLHEHMDVYVRLPNAALAQHHVALLFSYLRVFALLIF